MYIEDDDYTDGWGITNRNSEGRNDWTTAIGEALYGIERDFIDEQSNAYDVMEG